MPMHSLLAAKLDELHALESAHGLATDHRILQLRTRCETSHLEFQELLTAKRDIDTAIAQAHDRIDARRQTAWDEEYPFGK